MSRRQLDRAADDWRAFHWGDEPSEIIDADVYRPNPREVLTVLGKLKRVDYETPKAGELAIWWHEFSRPCPYLAASESGKLLIVGGRYRITPRGIVG